MMMLMMLLLIMKIDCYLDDDADGDDDDERRRRRRRRISFGASSLSIVKELWKECSQLDIYTFKTHCECTILDLHCNALSLNTFCK